MKLFYAFYKALVLSPALTSISHENTIEIPLTSKKSRLAKFCLVDACS